jgi:hypothetical protein
VVLAACGSDDSPTLAPSPASSAGIRSSASTPPPTAPTTSVARCGGTAAPPAAPQLTEATGDFDGDRTTDTMRVYSGGVNAPYHVNVELGNSRGVIDAVIADTTSVDDHDAPKAMGAASIAGAGPGAAAFVALIPGASTQFVAIYEVVGCDLVHLARTDDHSGQFAIGGSVTHQGGLACVADGLTVFSATSSDGVSYDASTVQLQVQDHTLVPTGPPVTGTVTATDPAFAAFGTFDCPGVAQP